MPEFIVEFGKDGSPPGDGRLDAAAFHRNHGAIAPVLEAFLQGRTGDVLEIGGGTGQHAVAFASRWPAVTCGRPISTTIICAASRRGGRMRGSTT
jgi:hypothetical protein